MHHNVAVFEVQYTFETNLCLVPHLHAGGEAEEGSGCEAGTGQVSPRDHR